MAIYMIGSDSNKGGGSLKLITCQLPPFPGVSGLWAVDRKRKKVMIYSVFIKAERVTTTIKPPAISMSIHTVLVMRVQCIRL